MENQKKESKKVNSNKYTPLFKKLIREEQIPLERIKELVRLLKLKYHLNTRDIINLIEEEEILIPISIFTKQLSILETITKYLKEELSLSLHQIGELLSRNERNIWHTYKTSNKKHPTKLIVHPTKHFIPISTFQNKLGALESIVLYLKDELNLSYHNIAVLLDRDDRTIWTVYNKAKKKNEI